MQPKTLKMYIGGQWVESKSGKMFEAYNSATGEVIGSLPVGTHLDAQRAIAAANESKHKIASMSVWDRAQLCRRISDVMLQRREELAHVLLE